MMSPLAPFFEWCIAGWQWSTLFFIIPALYIACALDTLDRSKRC